MLRISEPTGSTPGRIDHIKRSPAHLDVDTRHLFADHAHRDEHRPEEGEQDRKQGEDALELWPEVETPDEEEDAEGEAAERGEDAEHAHNLDREHRRADEQVDTELREAERAIPRPAEATLGMGDGNLGHSPGEAGCEGGNEERPLPAPEHTAYHVTAVRAKH